MHLTQRFIIVAVAAMAMVLCAGPAMARSYNGAWPVTVTGSQRSNGTGCLTLNGTPTGGAASLVYGGFKYPYGSFLVLNGILMATISEPLYGQNGALMFTAPANRGHIGQGIFENIEGGSNFDFGELSFGMKNRC
jgi:hypothetical protein